MARTRFHALLEEKVRREIDDKAKSVLDGAAADYAQYQFWVGYVKGMNACLDLCDDIERESEG